MKFNEKLTELRKKAGLSQEELGYKLNVTRQTVSKWELGQTTPEMDKLIEMGKIFNISVDELINESEVTTNVNPIIEDQPIKNESPKSNKIAIIVVIAVIVVVIYLLIKMASVFFAFNIFDKTAGGIIDVATNGATESEENVFDKFFSLFNEAAEAQKDIIKNPQEITETSKDIIENQQEVIESSKDIIENQQEVIENSKDIIENANNKIDKSKFNRTLELYKGSNRGSQLKSLLEEVIIKNKTEERKITVRYDGIETQKVEEIQNLKTNIKQSNNFEATFDYDKEGYINKVTIKKVITEFEIKSFNNALELYAGSSNGMFVTTALDSIITSNKTKEQKITVKYNGIETQDENEIRNIKTNFSSFDKCEITYEYDADGFINKAIIEKL